jgi:4-diphosphocytidyl-2-C-methyl-D-erythritol kinase
VIVFPHCKINLGLQVLQKRSDGFHDIATVFYPIPLKDALEIVPVAGELLPVMHTYGLAVEGAAADNLCMKAWQLLKKDFPDLPPVAVHCLKNIPMGAGLGGGSADGAFMLQLLNTRFQLGLSNPQLLAYALQLGSDCPFFIINKPCYGSGRGEILELLALNLAGYQLVLVHPGIHINTGWAFAQLQLDRKGVRPANIQQAIAQPIDQWRQWLVNDFEAVVFAAHPSIASVKENLYAAGAVYASMSGSGSTVFALFNKSIKPAEILPEGYRVIQL